MAMKQTLTRGLMTSMQASRSRSPHSRMLVLQQPEDWNHSVRYFSTNEEKEAIKEDPVSEDAATSTTEEAKADAPEADAASEEPAGPSVEELQEKLKDIEDQFRRSVAEQENIRMIARNDIEKAKQFSIKSFAKSLLEVSDNLQRALDSVPGGDLESNVQLRVLYEGIEMTNSEMTKAFASNGIKKYCDVPGDKFDPNLHNALMQYPDPEKEPDTVGQIIKPGYTLNDRVLRPAEVGVVKAA